MDIIYITPEWEKKAQAECDKIMKQLGLSLGKKLGAGAFGSAFEVCKDGKCDKYIVKIQHENFDWSNTLEEHTRREVIRHLDAMKNKLAPKLYASWVCNGFLRSTSYIVTERIQGEPLSKVWSVVLREDTLPSKVVKKLFIENMIDAINKLHAAKIYHCDLHYNNIIITRENKIKFIDFGIARNYLDTDIQYSCRNDFEIIIDLLQSYWEAHYHREPTRKELMDYEKNMN